jgi:hypothetical protein
MHDKGPYDKEKSEQEIREYLSLQQLLRCGREMMWPYIVYRPIWSVKTYNLNFLFIRVGIVNQIYIGINLSNSVWLYSIGHCPLTKGSSLMTYKASQCWYVITDMCLWNNNFRRNCCHDVYWITFHISCWKWWNSAKLVLLSCKLNIVTDRAVINNEIVMAVRIYWGSMLVTFLILL